VKLKRFRVDTRHWGILLLLQPLPKEERQGAVMMVDPWGDFACLREVPEFASLIPVVSGDVYSQAMHGYAKPLLEALGREPKFQLIKVPYKVCSQQDDCVMFNVHRCRPCPKMPECWQPEVEKHLVRAVAVVMLAWAEGRYVVVVEGAEFSL